MADQERKEDADKQDEGADEEAESAEAKGDAERDDAAGALGEGGGDATPGEDDDETDDAAARRVARALGVDDGAEGAAADEEPKEGAEPAKATNRAARRRDEAVERRKKRKGASQKAEDAEPELPKDKNARAKELLKRRREQAAGTRPIQLLPGEMVDDALARSTSAAGKWLRENFNKLQWVILAALVGLGGYLLYTSQTQKKGAAATGTLFTGIAAELGRVAPEDKRPDEEKEVDPTKVYKTVEERSEAAMAGYKKAITDYPESTVAQLAKLGEAGVLLDKRDWAGAVDAYSAVLASKLASVDVDVKGRATEGLGLAKEGKGDLDGAMAAFKDMQAIDARGYKELGMYQEARILLAKGDKEKAKELLKQVRDKLQTGGEGSSLLYLPGAVDEALRRIDPSLVPQSSSLGGPKGNSMSPEEMEKFRKLIEDAAKKKAHEGN